MNDRRTIVMLSGVFLLLIVALIFQTRQLEEESQQPTPAPTITAALIFPNLTVNQIQAIQLREPQTGEALTLARSGDRWIVPGVERSFDQDQAELVARTMVLISSYRSFDPSDADYTRYGFTPDADFYVQVITTAGDEHSIAVGGAVAAQSFDTAAFYALVDERAEIYIIDRAALDFLYLTFAEPPFIN